MDGALNKSQHPKSTICAAASILAAPLVPFPWIRAQGKRWASSPLRWVFRPHRGKAFRVRPRSPTQSSGSSSGGCHRSHACSTPPPPRSAPPISTGNLCNADHCSTYCSPACAASCSTFTTAAHMQCTLPAGATEFRMGLKLCTEEEVFPTPVISSSLSLELKASLAFAVSAGPSNALSGAQIHAPTTQSTSDRTLPACLLLQTPMISGAFHYKYVSFTLSLLHRAYERGDLRVIKNRLKHVAQGHILEVDVLGKKNAQRRP